MVMGISFLDRFMAPKIRTKPLPAESPISEKERVKGVRGYATQRPLPNVPNPPVAYVVNPMMIAQPQPRLQRTASQQVPSQTSKRTRTNSQGPPIKGILKNKGQANAPHMQASGGFGYDYYPQYTSQSWPSASMPHPGWGGYSTSQLDHYGGHHHSARDSISRHHAHAHNGTAPPMERRRSTHTSNLSRSRPQYQASDSPVSDDSDHGNEGPPVAVLQVRASNYISAYVRPVRMKPEVYHLCWPLKPAKPDKHGVVPRKIYFDIAFDPRENGGRKIGLFDSGLTRSIHPEELDMPATTHCVLMDMTIVHSDPRFAPWTVNVHRKEGIRCRDIFTAVYDTFHKPVRDDDEISEEDKKAAEKHRHNRCKDSSGLFEYNWRQGLLRVDVLRSRRIFAGLEQDGSQWKLYLASYMTA